MNSREAIDMIEAVMKKLEHHKNLNKTDKVIEYLEKLKKTSVTSSLLQETKIDALINELASNKTAPYAEVAKSLLEKWQNKKSQEKISEDIKVKSEPSIPKTSTTKRTSIKRKSQHELTVNEKSSMTKDFTHIKTEPKTIETSERTDSESVKKRKVLSLSEYVNNKKPVPSTIKSESESISETQAEQIYAQFNANLGKLHVNPTDLSKIVEKKLTQTVPVVSNRPNPTTTNQETRKDNQTVSLWSYDDDDDEQYVKPIIKSKSSEKKSFECKEKSQPTKPTQTPQIDKNPKSNADKTKVSTNQTKPTLPKVKSEPTETFHVPKPPIAQASSAPVVPTRKPTDLGYDLFRPKKERQAVYSGKRTIRTSIPSLQELALEVLKENVETVSHKHFCLLPYDLVKPVIEMATPEQLHNIIDHNPNYLDEVEPLWKEFCRTHFKEDQREENESYYELYLRKFREQEEKLQQITLLAKRKKEETVDTGRQTKKISFPTRYTNGKSSVNSQITASSCSRIIVDLPSGKGRSGKGFGTNAAVKKPAMPQLLKKTLKIYQGKH